ncbi:hypothetical protein Tco_0865471 [Tanacetum coccineum]
MDDPNLTMEEYIRLEEEKAHKRGKVFNWQTATYGNIRVDNDLHNLSSVEAEFPAIVINDAVVPQDELQRKSQLKTLQFLVLGELGAYTSEAAPDRSLIRGDLRDYWMGISSAGDFLGTALSYNLIRDLILRLCHRLIACSIDRRSQAPKKVTVTDLFYLRGMDFVARNIGEHFGLLTTEILGGLTVITPELPIIDMTELVRLQICAQFDDTWAWVAMGPERQPDAAVGPPDDQ